MLFGKKKEKKFNAYENHADELLYELQDTECHLEECIEKSIVRTGVVPLYPDGADRRKAQSDADEAKHSLLVAIGAFDTTRMIYNDYVNKNQEKFDNPRKPWKSTSHEIIERVYRNFYKKG